MGKKKNKTNGSVDGNGFTASTSSQSIASSPDLSNSSRTESSETSESVTKSTNSQEPQKRNKDSKSKSTELPSTPSLAISRNKHWRYISAFHGPWLQLPHELLETLAHSNFLAPRPRSTDAGVLYDLIKIRKLVDEASDLAVRAQNGTASSALVGSDNGLPGGSLGLSYRGIGGNAKLSPERKYRMRELATQKLSQAYRLDEVAASVATMQGASALDNIASLVLQRSPNNVDAKYVHFFHEKIPSRMMAEFTSLEPLNEIIAAAPGHASLYRTRALTKIFKDDLVGAIQDLTESLALCRLEAAKHKAGRTQLVTMQMVREEAEKKKVWSREWMQENRVLDEDQPKGVEMQLLFQRGNQYLTIACRHIKTAIDGFRRAQRQQATAEQAGSNAEANGARSSERVDAPAAVAEAYTKALEARETIRKNAKRALRDYTTFLSKLDYAYAPVKDDESEVFSRPIITDDLEEYNKDASAGNASRSNALVRRSNENDHRHRQDYSPPPDMTIYEMSTLVSTSPPTDIPQFPPHNEDSSNATHDETLTYHPLLPETLHALLLAHCLLQTPPTALLRHANHVARLVRLADGYPFFLAARSPARADWSEILRKTSNFAGLAGTWESLCKVPTVSQYLQDAKSKKENTTMTGIPELPNGGEKGPSSQLELERRARAVGTVSSSVGKFPVIGETQSQRRDRIHKEAVMEALGDERVVDDETFQRAVEAREKRAWRDIVEEVQAQKQHSQLAHAGTKSIEGLKEVSQTSGSHIGTMEEAGDLELASSSTEVTLQKPEVASMNGHAQSAEPAFAQSRPNVTTATTSSASTIQASAPAQINPQASASKSKTNGTAKAAKVPALHKTFTAKDEEYLIGTERAEAIAKWILEAPTNIASGDRSGTKNKKGKARKKPSSAKVKTETGGGERAEGLATKRQSLSFE